MVARLIFVLLALFWGTMSFLLWRAEYGSRDSAAATVPVEVIWRKILTAPDSSALSILQDGRRIGFCHLVTSIGEEFAKLDDTPPEGMAAKVNNYVIKLDGNISLAEYGMRLRFDLVLKLSTNRTWQEFELRLTSRPVLWEFRASAAEKILRFRTEEAGVSAERALRFADLRNPYAWVREFGGDLGLPFIAGLQWPPAGQSDTAPVVGIRWTGKMDTLRLGHEPVRVYRLQTRLLDRYCISIWVSRAGEILRAELPDKIVLLHDQLGGMSAGAK